MMKILVKRGPGKPAANTLSEGEPGWSTDTQRLYVGDGRKLAVDVAAPRNYIDVKDYGAVGDGTTDDQPAISRAITAAGFSGLPVYFPSGDYLAASAPTAITTPVSLWLFGDHRDKSTIIQKGKNAGILKTTTAATASNELRISGLSFKKDTSVTTYGWPVALDRGVVLLELCRFELLICGPNSYDSVGYEIMCTGTCLGGASPLGQYTVQGGAYEILDTWSNNSYQGELNYSHTVFDARKFAPSSAASRVAMIVSDDGTSSYDHCRILLSKDTDYSKHVFVTYSGGSVNVSDCVFEWVGFTQPAAKKINAYVAALGAATITRGLTFVGNSTTGSDTAPAYTKLIDIRTLSQTGPVHIETKGPKSEVLLPSKVSHGTVEGNDVPDTWYQKHSDGIFWNGTKITP